MASLRRMLEQLQRHVEFTHWYQVEHYENMRLEAQHGYMKDPDWILSEEARNVWGNYGNLLAQALTEMTVWAKSFHSKRTLLRSLRQSAHRTEQILRLEKDEEEFASLTSYTWAKRELWTVALDTLRGEIYTPRSYHEWKTSILNWWRHPRYLPDEEAIGREHYWVDSLTKVVLFDDSLQVRWGAGRVLVKADYQEIAEIAHSRHGHYRYWTITLRDGKKETIRVDWMNPPDLERLAAELVQRCGEQVSRLT